MAIGRLTLAHLQAYFISEMVKEGYITGSGPIDPALRNVWLVTHQPYSVRSKEGWIPITNLEPASTPFGLVADFTQIMDQLDGPTAEQGAMASVFTIMQNFADKTWWRTLSDVV